MQGPSTQTALNIKAEENPTLNDLDEADVGFALQHPNNNTIQQKIIEGQVSLTLKTWNFDHRSRRTKEMLSWPSSTIAALLEHDSVWVTNI